MISLPVRRPGTNATPLPLLAATLVALAGCGDGPTAVEPPGAIDVAARWMEVAPAEVDIDGAALDSVGAAAASIERLRSLLVVRRGRLAWERYYHGWTADTLADVRSVTKSVVSTLVGLALEDGSIRSLDQPITDFLRAPAFPVRPEHGAITLRHLLTMTGGFDWAEEDTNIYSDWVRSADQIAFVLDRPLASTPGSTFVYNSGAVHLLGVILEQATGSELEAYADRRLFSRIGVDRRIWEPATGGYVNGGAGLDLRPRDMARFGQLFLQDGWSGSRAVVPAPWVEEATVRRFTWTIPEGPIEHVTYGYLWWIDVDHDAWFAWGHGGQFVYVVPSKELVVVTTTEWRNVSQDIGVDALHALVLSLIVDGVLPTVH